MDLIGYLAATVTTASILPQLLKIVRTKSANDISIWMFLVYFAGDSLWFYYGCLMKSVPIMLSNLAALMVIFTIILLTKKYTHK